MKLSLRIKPNAWSINNTCIYIFFIMTAIIFLYQYDNLAFNLRYGFMSIGAILGFWICINNKNKFYQPLILLIALSICWLFCFLGQSGYLNYSFANYLYTVLYIGLSVVLLRNEYNHSLTLAIYFFTALTILLRIIQNVNMNHILLANSRNFISVLLLLPLLFYYVSCHDKKKPIYVLPAILYFYISIYAVGRGGIVSSGFLVIALCIYKITQIENKNIKRLMWLIIIIIAFTVGLYMSNLNSLVIGRFLNSYFSRFLLKGATDTSRVTIWNEFFTNNLDSLASFLLGSNTSLVRYDGNLHNSFIQAYASFGLMGFLILLVLLGRAIIQGFKQRDALFLILLFGLSLRAFTDRVFFQGYCEIFLYYFILYWDYKKHYFFAQDLPPSIMKQGVRLNS